MNKPDYSFALITVVVNFGIGSKVLTAAKRCGISGGTLLIGKGTAKSRILEFLELSDTRKEIVLMGAECCLAHSVIMQLDKEFTFRKKGHGIAFLAPVVSIFGASRCQCSGKPKKGDVMYKTVITIVDRGRAEAVIEAAEKAGSRGGTIINGRGAGIHETRKLFSMEIEPEKEIVLIVAEDSKSDAIVASIRDHLEIDEPGKGIIFIQDVLEAYGLN